jgi:predicted ATP-grasp superfamily ATP-dependent carboligase/CelD/BcsL family acetyltransferase involved in cellulose biosynthesis
MALTFAVLTDIAELEALRPAWNELLQRSNAGGPMLSPTWLLAWWRVFGGLQGRRLAAVAFRDRGRLVGLAPLLARTHWYDRAVPFRRLELLGSGEPEEDEICSEYLDIVVERGAETAVTGMLATAVAAGALGRWDEVVLEPIDGSSSGAALLAAELTARGGYAETERTGAAHHIPLPPTWPEYLERLTSPDRYLITRALRDFEQWAGGGARLRIAGRPEELAEGRRALVSLHGERWDGGGAFSSRRFTAFHDEVMPALLDEGALELSWLTVRGEAVAAAYHLVGRGKVSFYQSGRRLDLPRGLRPGIVMHALAIRRAIEAGRREYDFLGGVARYKRQLALAARPLVRVRAVRARDGLRERARGLLEGGLQGGRGALRRVLTRSPEPGRAGDDPEEPGSPRSPGTAVLHGDLNMLRCFAGTGVPTVVLSSNPEDPTFFSRHCGQRRLIAPAGADPAGALADLLRLGELLPGRPALYYGDDAMLLLVSRNREALGARFRFLLPDADRVEALVDKTRFAALGRALDLPVPRTVASSEADRAPEIARLLAPPFILKPFCHLGWAQARAVKGLGLGPLKALRADRVDELARMIDLIGSFSPSFVVQEYIPGGEDQVYSFHAYLDARGRSLGHYVGRKIRTYPRSAGVSTYLELVDEPEVVRAGRDVLARLGHRGVVKLDFKRDPRTGRFYLLEVNPRYNLWNHLGAACGLNLPLIAHQDLLSLPAPPAAAARPGVRWLAFGDDARAFLRDYAPAGELSWTAWLRSLRGPKVYDVFAWDDASPFVVSMVQKLRRRTQAERAGAPG